ncbi:distal tail protein Dit [Cohnella lubricantis]|uniref:Phage tail family protein n=1 Tax=Cohnella lubricantis TaxID=2163172 RepID=A0A841T5C1_9BACL|nr:distal tail protein Dit [Cohnella lubricantis]MBB6676514.1 phage tail family protein [Cohnella lubricantis]MBP2117134.1 putative phage tail component-like protein [Cohnella lubricantis]
MYGFTYRGRHSSEFGITLLSSKINSPDLREYEDEVTGLPGVIDYGTEFGKRQIDLSIDITPSNEPFKVQQSRIYNWLNPTQAAGVLVFDETPDRYYYAKFTAKLGLQQIGKYGTFEFSMKCTDPFAYGYPHSMDQRHLYDFGLQYDSGLIYPNPTGFEWLYGEQRSSLQNYGPMETGIKITIAGNAIGGSIEHEQSGKRLWLPTMIGQSLVIDTGEMTANLNGLNALPQMSGDFFDLHPGVNGLIFRAAAASAVVQYDWRFKYL